MFLTFLGVCVLLHTCLNTDAASQPQLRNVINDKNMEWQRGMVVYQVSSLFDDSQVGVIEESMREIEHDVSTVDGNCITFQKKEGPYRNHHDYLYIVLANDDVCKTEHTGMVGGRQKLFLTDNCMYKRDIMSLLLVTLGLYHEHQRPDRDQYIHVDMDNVQNVAKPLFGKIPAGDTDLLGLPYDFDSITHFGPYEFAKDSHRPTITATVTDVSFGNKRMLSYRDVMKVQILYICGKDTSHITNSPALAVNCDFESFLCNLADDYMDDFKWIRQSSSLGQNGPTADHSSGSGYYLYANGTGNFNKTARLLSAREIPPGEYCASMHYFIVGDTKATLTVKTYDYVNDTETTISSRTTNQGSNVDGGWYQYRTYINIANHKWRIYIEGYIKSEDGGVAIDDVQVYPGVCS